MIQHTRIHPTRSRARHAAIGLVVLSLGLGAGCADEKDDADTGTGTNTETTAVNADSAAFCDAVVAVDKSTLPLQGPPGEAPDPAVVEAATSAMDTAGEAAPDEVADAVATLVADGKAMLEGGDQSEGYDAASAEVYGWLGDNCGFNTVDVTAKEYEYSGMPGDLTAGPAVLSLTNEGKELHEMMYLRVNDDVDLTTDEILALPEEEGLTKVEMVGGAFALPGASGHSTVDLTAGRYIVVCFIPVGLTPDAAAAAETGGAIPDGPPHFTQGMVHEITVT